MKMLRRSILAGVLALILLASLCACAGGSGGGTEGTAAAEEVSAELYGSPRIDSLVSGNLPGEAPDAKDDLFLHYNYDEIKAHQGEYYSMMVANTNCVQDYVSDKMEEGTLAASEGSTYSAAELAQLKILYDQGTDLETLQKLEVLELQPYLDRISGAASIKELNSVLVSEDFPFSPYLYMTVSAYDMSKANNVFIYPELLFVDNIDGADYYQDSDDDINRLTDTSKDLISCFGKQIEKTSWLSESSRKEMLLKLDKMRLNILSPEGGYVDFCELSLTPTEEGGTLLGNYLKLKTFINDKRNARIGKERTNCSEASDGRSDMKSHMALILLDLSLMRMEPATVFSKQKT